MGRLIKKDALPHTPLSLTEGNPHLYSVLLAHRQKQRFIEEAKSGLLEVVVQLAQQLVGDAVVHHPAILEKKYNDILSTVQSLAPLSLRVHPLGIQHTHIEAMAEKLGIRVVGDDTLHPADCMVQGGDIVVDATVECALYHFKKMLLQ